VTGASSRPDFVVAIDGPAGSGKSTTARLCARKLGFHHLDTGAMYRAVALKVIRTATPIEDQRRLARLLSDTVVEPVWSKGGMHVRLDRRDVSREIREPAVSARVSEVSAIPAVRRKLVAEQRRAARGVQVVCEGRDIGSVVFPDAKLKVFLVCDTPERAQRRHQEWIANGVASDPRIVERGLTERDRIDSSRRMSPLRRVPDAILVDTTHLTIEEQVAVVCVLARERMVETVER
jgi:cytidylate kinase